MPSPEDAFSTGNDDADAFLNLWKSDANQPSDEGEDETKNTQSDEQPDDEDQLADDASEETPEDEGDEDESEGEDDKETKPKPKADPNDDLEVSYTVDGTEHKTTVKQLKRLAGQEAALTRKSQEVAEVRKKADEAGQFHVAGLQAMLTKAQDRFAPYANLNFLALAKDPNISPEELSALQEEATKAYEDVAFLEQGLNQALTLSEQRRKTALAEEAKATLTELTDPEKGIKGFDQKMYDDMRLFAVHSGVPVQVVNEIASAPILRILHKAMLYDRGQKAATVKKDTKLKKIVKSTSTPEATRAAVAPDKKAMKALREAGTTDAAADAFMAKWAK